MEDLDIQRKLTINNGGEHVLYFHEAITTLLMQPPFNPNNNNRVPTHAYTLIKGGAPESNIIVSWQIDRVQ